MHQSDTRKSPKKKHHGTGNILKQKIFRVTVPKLRIEEMENCKDFYSVNFIPNHFFSAKWNQTGIQSISFKWLFDLEKSENRV